METEEILIIRIMKQILSSILILIILGTSIFVYNAASVSTDKIEEIAKINNNQNQEKELVKIAKAEKNNNVQREIMTQTTRSTINNREKVKNSTKTINKTEENKEQETKKYVQIKDVIISKNMDLTVRTNLSKEDFKTLISTVKHDTSKFFYDNADYIYELCEKYELNEIFFCGLISAESGWNIAPNHRRAHNYISLMLNGNLIKYGSVEQGLEVAAKMLHQKYLTKGGTFYFGKTLSAVKTRFCPASSTWTDLVYGRMKQIIK